MMLIECGIFEQWRERVCAGGANGGPQRVCGSLGRR
jgi:hypothetical protein